MTPFVLAAVALLVLSRRQVMSHPGGGLVQATPVQQDASRRHKSPGPTASN